MTPKQIEQKLIWQSVKARPAATDKTFARYAVWVFLFHVIALCAAAVVLGK